MRESEVEGIDDHRVREDGSVCVIGSGIQVIFQERASAGPICVPGVTFQTMSKSWRKRDQ